MNGLDSRPGMGIVDESGHTALWQLGDIETIPVCLRNIGRFLESDPFRIARGDISHYRSVQPICWMTDDPLLECIFMNCEKSHGYCTTCRKWFDFRNDIDAVLNHICSDEHKSHIADAATEIMVDTAGIVHYIGIEPVEMVMGTILVISRNNSPSLLERVIGSPAGVHRVRFDELELFALADAFDCVVVLGGEELSTSDVMLLTRLLIDGFQFTPQCIVFEGSCSAAAAMDASLKGLGMPCPIVVVLGGAGALCLCEIGSLLPKIAEPLALRYMLRWRVFVANHLEKRSVADENSWLMSFGMLGRARSELFASFNGFDEVTSLASLRMLVLKDVRAIPRGSFRDCLLVSVDLTGVEEIGFDAFLNCCGLEFVLFDSKLRVVGCSAFSGTGLCSLDLSSSSELELDNCCFSCCARLRSVDLPSSIKMGDSIFRYSPLTDRVFMRGVRLSTTGLTSNVFEHARMKHFGISCVPVSEVVNLVKKLRCMDSRVVAVGMDGVQIVDLGSPVGIVPASIAPKVWAGWSRGVRTDQPFHLDLSGCKVTEISHNNLSAFGGLRSFVASANLAVLGPRAFAEKGKLVFVDLRPARRLLKLPSGCFTGTSHLRRLLIPSGVQVIAYALGGSALRELDISGVKCEEPNLGHAGSLHTLICGKVSLSGPELRWLAALSALAFSGKIDGQRSSIRRLRLSGPVQADEQFLAAERAFVLTELEAYGIVKGRPALPG